MVERLTLLVWLAGSSLPALASAASKEQPQVAWKTLQPGVEYARVEVKTATYISEKGIHIVRLDPAVVRLRPLIASELDRRKKTTKQWSEEFGLAVAINLGMFNVDDHLTHTGHLRHGTHVNSPKWVTLYKSALAFGPRTPDLPPAVLLDLDESDTQVLLKSYDTVVQNLRLIKGAGQNAWGDNKRKWSEAALAIDENGRLLLIFCRTSFAMKEFNRLLLSLPLGIQRAMHLEGGPEASLSIHAGGIDLDLCGSFESGFWENDSNSVQWPVPNVLGVERLKDPK